MATRPAGAGALVVAPVAVVLFVALTAAGAPGETEVRPAPDWLAIVVRLRTSEGRAGLFGSCCLILASSACFAGRVVNSALSWAMSSWSCWFFWIWVAR